MSELKEMTYVDHINGKIEICEKKINEILREITLSNKDYNNGILNDFFFAREDISNVKKQLVLNLNKELQEYKIELSKIS